MRRLAVVHAVTGIRGIGKTQLAAAYARECLAENWFVVAWITADTRDLAVAGMAELADRLGERAHKDDFTAADAARRWLEKTDKQALVVFDNVGMSPAELKPLLPTEGSAHVIITTTRQAYVNAIATVQVSAFTSDEAIAYLHQRTGRDPSDAHELVADLGHMPLALAQAASLIDAEGLTYAEYRELLKSVPLTESLPTVDGLDYPRGTAEAIALSVQHAETGQDPFVRAAADALGVLDPAGIPRDLLRKVVAELSPDAMNTDFDRAMGRLAEASLLSFGVNETVTVIVHRLIQHFLRDRVLLDGTLITVAAAAIRVLEREAVPDEDVWRQHSLVGMLADQAESVWSAITPIAAAHARAPSGENWVRRLLDLRNQSVACLSHIADFLRAIPIGISVSDDSEQLLGSADPTTVASRNQLAGAYCSAGRLDAAIALQRETLASCERILGADHQDTLTSRNNLGTAYQQARRSEEAIALHEVTLERRERTLGSEHPDTLATCDNLGSSYRSVGRLAESADLLQSTLANRERVLGVDHPDSLISRDNLARTYWSQGKLTDAITLFESTLAARERVLGLDHPDTLTSRNNLGSAYQSATRFNEAIALHQSTLSDRARILGPDHPDTLTSRNDLAGGYQSAGRLEEAIEQYETILIDQKRLIGEDHPDTRVTVAKLKALRIKVSKRTFFSHAANRYRTADIT